jgi:hypothetical protein
MRTLRTALTAVALCLLCVGYAASQIAYWRDSIHISYAMEYAARVDTPPVQHLAGILLLSAVILAFIREKQDPEQPADRNSNPATLQRSDTLPPEHLNSATDECHEVSHLPFTVYRLPANPRHLPFTIDHLLMIAANRSQVASQ